MSNRRAFLLTSFFAALLVSLVACSWLQNITRPTPAGTYPIDPIFRQYYAELGGAEVLGPAISPVFADKQNIYQYTVTVLMRYDGAATAGHQYSLMSIGRDLGLFELPNPEAQPLPGVYRDGQVIFEPFVPLYEALGGAPVVGKPLTAAHRNTSRGRYEQYFENVGFYWLEGADEGVYLLAYGAWKCGEVCEHKPPEPSLVTQSRRQVPAFVRAVATLGLDFTGFALTGPYLTSDGRIQQIYENVILVTGAQDAERVELFPVAVELGITRGNLENPYPGPGMTFYPVEGQLGFNIPEFFLDYLEAHGGLPLAGPPITALAQPEQGIYRQCFTNICLEAFAAQDGSLAVKPVPLGVNYRDAYYHPDKLLSGDQPALNLTLHIWVRHPVVSPDQTQAIGVAVQGNDIPLYNILPELTLTLPDGRERTYQMDPTDDNGETIFELPALPGGNGTLVPYKVCVATPDEREFCLKDHFLIWQTTVITVTPTLLPGHTSYLPFVMRNIDIYAPAFIDTFKTYLPVMPRQH